LNAAASPPHLEVSKLAVLPSYSGYPEAGGAAAEL
jgi:hypothetical protein